MGEREWIAGLFAVVGGVTVQTISWTLRRLDRSADQHQNEQSRFLEETRIWRQDLIRQISELRANLAAQSQELEKREEQVNQLQRTTNTLADENRQLKADNTRLQAQVDLLRSEIEALRRERGKNG